MSVSRKKCRVKDRSHPVPLLRYASIDLVMVFTRLQSPRISWSYALLRTRTRTRISGDQYPVLFGISIKESILFWEYFHCFSISAVRLLIINRVIGLSMTWKSKRCTRKLRRKHLCVRRCCRHVARAIHFRKRISIFPTCRRNPFRRCRFWFYTLCLDEEFKGAKFSSDVS